MAIAYKSNQVSGTASVSTFATLYDTSAAGKTAVVSTLGVCNTASTAVTVRVGMANAAGTPAASEWILYDRSVPANDTLLLTIGLAMQNAEYLRVSSSASTCAFFASIAEIS
jgi:hypothetical protein